MHHASSNFRLSKKPYIAMNFHIGHLTEHIVHQDAESKREEDPSVVLKVLDSYIK